MLNNKRKCVIHEIKFVKDLNWRAYDFFAEGHPRRWEVTLNKNLVLSNELIKVELPPGKIKKADVSRVSPSSERMELWGGLWFIWEWRRALPLVEIWSYEFVNKLVEWEARLVWTHLCCFFLRLVGVRWSDPPVLSLLPYCITCTLCKKICMGENWESWSQ